MPKHTKIDATTKDHTAGKSKKVKLTGQAGKAQRTLRGRAAQLKAQMKAAGA